MDYPAEGEEGGAALSLARLLLRRGLCPSFYRSVLSRKHRESYKLFIILSLHPPWRCSSHRPCSFFASVHGWLQKADAVRRSLAGRIPRDTNRPPIAHSRPFRLSSFSPVLFSLPIARFLRCPRAISRINSELPFRRSLCLA